MREVCGFRGAGAGLVNSSVVGAGMIFFSQIGLLWKSFFLFSPTRIFIYYVDGTRRP